MDGVVVVDKPQGPTSHDVVARARRTLRTREIGHAGTLDPMATGVLVLAVGEATKLVPWLTAHSKAYRATVRLGVATTTLDAEGEVIERRDVDPRVLEDLDAAIDAERARVEQVPPLVSAIKIGGVAAHERVRRGEVIDLAPRPVAVHELRVLEVRHDAKEIDLEVSCAKGYYVRSLARDLATRLGTVGHLTMLRRLRSGPFEVDEAVGLDELASGLVPLAVAAERALGASRLTAAGALKARQGKRLAAEDFEAPARSGVSAWIEGGELVAVGEVSENDARVLRGFRAR